MVRRVASYCYESTQQERGGGRVVVQDLLIVLYNTVKTLVLTLLTISPFSNSYMMMMNVSKHSGQY
jgi:hypothetical protein